MTSLRLILTNPKYFAPAWVFASLNIWFGTWAIYIPSVKERLAIDKAQLGIAIFFLSLGVFTVFPIASKLINRLSVGRATWWGVVLCSFFSLFPLLVPNYILLCSALFFFGATHGFLDIAMNTLVTEIEKKEQKKFMTAAHGFFSLGGILVGLSSFLIPVVASPFLHMFLAIVVVFTINLVLKRHYFHIAAAPVEKEPFSLKLFKPLFLLGLVGFVTMGSEGGIVDWSGLYLKEMTMAPEALIGSGFLAFSTAMTLGRFVGDGISAKIGSVKIVALGALIAIIGYLFVLTESTLWAIVGFGLNGLGLSVIVPELFRIGGTVKGVESSAGVAFIAGTGYTGFLIGPVALGFLAENGSLKWTFLALLGGISLVFLITFLLQGQKRK